MQHHNFFKPIILQRPFCAIAGVLGGLLLTQAVNYELAANSEGKYPVSRTYVQWQNDTGMSREEIDLALAATVNQGLIEVNTDDPKLLKFKVNHKAIDDRLAGVGEKVEVKKEESVAKQLALSVPIPETSSEMVLSNPTPKEIDVKRITKEQIQQVFLPVYLEHKYHLWTTHEKLPDRAVSAIRDFIKDKKFSTIEDAIAGFVSVLTWCKECDDNFYRRTKSMPITHITSNGKLSVLFDCCRDAMNNDPVYRGRVLDDSKSMDVNRVLPGIDPEQARQAQAALEAYRQQEQLAQQSAPQIIEELWQ
jgi:hypothetical protein